MRAVTDAIWGSMLLLACSACGGGADPTITAITSLEPGRVPVGVASLLNGKVAVTDDDGDLATLRVTLTTPSKEVVQSSIDVGAEAGAARNSTISLQLQVLPPEAGTYLLDVIAVDREGNESGAVGTTFLAED